MATVQCVTPINQAIYKALLDKAASYPADKQYQANAYKKAAESVSGWNYSLYNEYLPSIPGTGPSIQKFIEEFIKNEVFPSEKNDYTAMDTARKIAAENAPQIELPKPVAKQCMVPANQPIYEALIKKAGSYPDQNGYQANAYRKAAESVLTFEHDIVAGVSKYNDYWSMAYYVPNVGTKIAKYIKGLVIEMKNKNTAAVTAPPAMPETGITIIAKADGKGIAIDYPDNKTLINFIKDIMKGAGITKDDL